MHDYCTKEDATPLLYYGKTELCVWHSDGKGTEKNEKTVSVSFILWNFKRLSSKSLCLPDDCFREKNIGSTLVEPKKSLNYCQAGDKSLRGLNVQEFKGV